MLYVFYYINNSDKYEDVKAKSKIINAILHNSNNFNSNFQTPDRLPPLDILTSNYYDTETALYCAYLVNVAYGLNENVKYNSYDGDEAAKSYLFYEIIKTIPYFSIPEIFAYHCPNGSSSYAGFILEVYDPKPVVFIIFRGTIRSCEWVEDFKFNLETPFWARDVKVHSGFNNFYINKNSESIRYKLHNYLFYENNTTRSLYNTSKIIISGHSLGGGISNLVTADISKNYFDLRTITKIFTFAAPYSGDKNFTELMNKNGSMNYSGLFAIINLTDIVPTTKINKTYSRPEYQLFFFKAGNNIDFNPLNSHLMNAYISGITTSRYQFDNAKHVPPGIFSWQQLCGYNLGTNMLKKEFLNHKECEFCDICPPS